MLAIRLRRIGSTKKPFFRVVVVEARSPRDTNIVENVGTYNPRMKPARVELDKARVQYWIGKGAKASDSVRTLLEKHLTRDLAVKPAAEAPAAG
jgi:small subunit ribosomal protein S16